MNEHNKVLRDMQLELGLTPPTNCAWDEKHWTLGMGCGYYDGGGAGHGPFNERGCGRDYGIGGGDGIGKGDQGLWQDTTSGGSNTFSRRLKC